MGYSIINGKDNSRAVDLTLLVKLNTEEKILSNITEKFKFLMAERLLAIKIKSKGYYFGLSPFQLYQENLKFLNPNIKIPHGGGGEGPNSALLQIVFFITSVREAAEHEIRWLFPKFDRQ